MAVPPVTGGRRADRFLVLDTRGPGEPHMARTARVPEGTDRDGGLTGVRA
jgi:hypothetical protein